MGFKNFYNFKIWNFALTVVLLARTFSKAKIKADSMSTKIEKASPGSQQY